MDHVYICIAAAIGAFTIGVIFSPGVSRLFALLFSDVKKEYAKALEEVKSVYDADTKNLRADLADVLAKADAYEATLKADWNAEVTKLKADLGEANNKVTVLTSVIKGATVLAPVPAPAPVSAPAPVPAPAPVSATAYVVNTKAGMSAALASLESQKAALQAQIAQAAD